MRRSKGGKEGDRQWVLKWVLDFITMFDAQANIRFGFLRLSTSIFDSLIFKWKYIAVHYSIGTF